MDRSITRWTPIAVLSLLVAATGAAHADDSLPPTQHQADVEWITGGIGLEESQAMQREAPHWPLALEFAQADKSKAVYTANVDVQIRNAAGAEVFNARSDGPFMLARLAPGRYTLNATLHGHTIQRPVTIARQAHAKLTLLWPADAE